MRLKVRRFQGLRQSDAPSRAYLDKTVWTVSFIVMSIAHQRKKQPAAVRRRLLDVAARLSAAEGPGSLTLDAVSQAAGVSKGGLLHHFSSKAALIDGLFDDLISRLDRAIDEAMRRDPVAHGRFTRAYLDAVFALNGEDEKREWHMLTIGLLSEPHLRERWRVWVRDREEEFVGTDCSIEAQLVRFAADGLWLADLIESHAFEPDRRVALLERLRGLTFL